MPIGLLLLVAIVQGLTEFLPISSSGHLVLIPLITKLPYQGQAIDVAAPVGTLIAVAIYLRSEILTIARAFLNFGRNDTINAKLGLTLFLATIPVIIAGYFVNYANWHFLELAQTIAIANLIFAFFLWIADTSPIKKIGLEKVTWQPALIIGIFQIFALIPGASRSGVTMSAARFLGYDRLTAARFSLLLSLPTIAGAGLLKSIDVVKSGDVQLGMDAIIVVALSAALALAAIHWMMNWLTTSSFGIFIYYRLALSGLLLIALAQGWFTPNIS